MEVIAKKHVSPRENRVRSSSFECDALAMDAILGLNAIGEKSFRLDTPQPAVTPKIEAWRSPQAIDWASPKSSTTALPAEVYAPTEIVSVESLHDPLSLETEPAMKRSRLLRLLDQQQSWYDAQQQAAFAAEQLLSLCEHHQQQWLHPNQQTP